MARTGRPRKPESEKLTARVVRFPPAVWEELNALVPEGKRSRFIQEEVVRGLKRLRRKLEKEEPIEAKVGGEHDDAI